MSDFTNSQSFKPRQNSGFLSRVKNKKSERAPDMEGSIDVNGVPYRLAGWVKTSQYGNKYVSLAVRPEHHDQNGSPPRTEPRTVTPQQPELRIDDTTESDGIPF